MKLRVEVIGAGIAGLSIGTMLARLGWRVRIHERSPYVREVGAGISLRNNCIGVLERYGIFEDLRPHGTTLRTEYSVDTHGRVLQARDLSGDFRTHVLPRQVLVEILAHAASAAGAEIRTSSRIVSADPSGLIQTECGECIEADLVIAADGVGSRIRQTVMPEAQRVERHTVVDRWLLDNQNHSSPYDMHEHWCSKQRVGIMPSGQGKTFVFLVSARSDKDAARFPIDVGAWAQKFPTLKSLFEELAASPGTQFPYQLVRSPAWSIGRVALLGDAAHSMPATLGQGAGLTTLNAHALAVLLTNYSDVEQALRIWERSVRFITDATQKWAVRYDQFTNQWPAALRPVVLGAFGRFPVLNRSMRIADKGLQLFDNQLAQT